MRRTRTRMRIGAGGEIEVVDPGFEALPLLRACDPGFRVRTAPLPVEVDRPAFQRARRTGCGMSRAQLHACSESKLWMLHDELVRDGPSGTRRDVRHGEVSLLTLKAVLARRLLRSCSLCARRCAVDRTRGEVGVCGLGAEAWVAEHFVHIAEEAPINPSLVLNLRGCGLRCRYCQQSGLLDPRGRRGERLCAQLWGKLDSRGARSLSFAGGNPDESLAAIFDFLDVAPHDWHLPLVWNHHAYVPREVSKLLRGIADVFLPDLKYFDDDCARRLSGVAEYRKTVTEALDGLIRCGAVVIVRVLVLPGHFECCHRPALEHLASIAPSPNVMVSIRGQYAPDWKITDRDGALVGRCTAEEVERVAGYARDLGLTLV